jgi:hypothetical protein
MNPLRERGIYLAPDGKTFVASTLRLTTSDGRRILSRISSEFRCFLFTRYNWAFHGLPDHEVAGGGNLMWLQQSAGWQVDQLIDTGTTAGAH